MAENNSNGASGGAQSAPDVPSSAEGAGPSLKDFLDFDPFEPSSEGKAPAPSDEPADGAAGDALPPKSEQQPQSGRKPRHLHRRQPMILCYVNCLESIKP